MSNKPVLGVAEYRDGSLKDVSFTVISAGRDVASVTNGALHIAIIGDGVANVSEELNCTGVHTIHTIEYNDSLTHDVYVQSLKQLISELDPSLIVVPHSSDGYDYAPALANEVDYPLLTDVINVSSNNGTVELARNLYGSKVRGVFAASDDRMTITVREGAWDAANSPGDASTKPFEFDFDESHVQYEVTGFDDPPTDDIDISNSEFIISVGRGIDEEENLNLVRELCEVTGATLAASRPLVDNGWIPKSRQVGQSGKTVTPDIYVAIGISGAIEHLAGMKGSDTIIAINTDPDAPIFDVADYGIVDDLFEVVPRLVNKFG